MLDKRVLKSSHLLSQQVNKAQISLDDEEHEAPHKPRPSATMANLLSPSATEGLALSFATVQPHDTLSRTGRLFTNKTSSPIIPFKQKVLQMHHDSGMLNRDDARVPI